MTTLTWDRHRGHASSYDVLTVGFNYRLDEIRAAMALVQLERLPALTRQRARGGVTTFVAMASMIAGPSMSVPGRSAAR